MTIDIITLFPNMFFGPFDESIIKRAQDKGIVTINVHNLRDWALDSYGTVDDRPYGGGIGMVLRPEPIVNALKSIHSASPLLVGDPPAGEAGGQGEVDMLTKALQNNDKRSVILTSAAGKPFSQQKAQELSQKDHLVFICGHYEGVDQRIADHYADEELSIGDYVLTGGELPTMVMIDSIVRLIPGVLSKPDAVKLESFSQISNPPIPSTPSHPSSSKTSGPFVSSGPSGTSLLEAPHYTRPDTFDGHTVPEVLKNGNHAEIEKWKQEEAKKRTKKNRPDLLTP